MLNKLKEEVCRVNKMLAESGLVILTWGNASQRDPETGLIAIKPSGVPFDELKPDDIVIVNANGEVVEGHLNPSSDLPTHLEIYKAFPEIGGVVHTHSTFSVAFAQAQRSIPTLGTTHADSFMGEIPLTRSFKKEDFVEYEKSTGQIIVETFKGRNPLDTPAVLVRNHGPFTFGKTAKEAFENALILENVAKMAYLTLRLKDEKDIVPETMLYEKHHDRKHGEHAYYGQKGKKEWI